MGFAVPMTDHEKFQVKEKKSNARLGSTRQPFKGCIADGCTKVHKEGYSDLLGKKISPFTECHGPTP